MELLQSLLGAELGMTAWTLIKIVAIVLPLMLFHQIQLMVCAVLAQRYARRLPSAQD